MSELQDFEVTERRLVITNKLANIQPNPDAPRENLIFKMISDAEGDRGLYQLNDDNTFTRLARTDEVSGGGLSDAPSDGTIYGRQDATWVSIPGFISVLKPSDTTRTSSGLYTVDEHLVSPTLEANTYYRLELQLLFTANATPDFRFRINRTGLADATLRYASDLDNNAATALTWLSANTAAGSGETNYRLGSYLGFIQTGSETGTMSIEWGQATSSALETTLRAGSAIFLRKIG